MTNTDSNSASLLKTSARWPVSGRNWRLVAFTPNTSASMPDSHQEELSKDEVRHLAQQVGKTSSHLQELDAAQTKLFLQVRDLHGRLSDIAPALARLEQQISNLQAMTASAMLPPIVEEAATRIIDLELESVPTEEWISVKDAAQFLGVNPSTVRRYIARGFLEMRRLPTGRGLRLLRSQVEQVLQSEPDQE